MHSFASIQHSNRFAFTNPAASLPTKTNTYHYHRLIFILNADSEINTRKTDYTRKFHVEVNAEIERMRHTFHK